MPNKRSKWAFVFRDSRDALDGPMMRLRGRSAPLFVRAGGQSGNHGGNQAREGPPGADGKPLAGPETNRTVRGGRKCRSPASEGFTIYQDDGAVGLARTRASLPSHRRTRSCRTSQHP